MINKFKKKGQEEMVGFAVIIIIVGVILLVLLSFMIGNKKDQGPVESYGIESFIQASLQYSSSCENELEFLSIQRLISACDSGTTCLDNRNSCDVLNETIKGIIDSGWSVGNGSVIQGYKFTIMSSGEQKLLIQKGNETSNYQGGFQDFANGIDSYEVSLNVYY